MSGHLSLIRDVLARRGWQWGRAAGTATVAFAAVFVPSDLLDTALFTRMTPPYWWDYVLATATVLLTAVASGLGRSPCADRGSVGTVPITATGAVVLAVGCPLCNKVVLAVMGTAGALELWAPLQPALGAAAVLALSSVVVLRWHTNRDDDGLGETPIADTADTPDAQAGATSSGAGIVIR